MIAKITKLISFVCALSAADPAVILSIKPLFEAAETEDEIEDRLLSMQRKSWADSVRMMQYMKNNYLDFSNAIYDFNRVRLEEATSEVERNLLRLLVKKLDKTAQILELMDDNVFYVYLVLQGIAVQRPDADKDFTREFTLKRVVAFLSNISTDWKDILPDWKKNFNAEMAKNGPFAAKFNEIRDGIRSTRPDLLPSLNDLFGLSEGVV